MKKHLIAALLVAAPLCASAQTAIPTGPNGPVQTRIGNSDDRRLRTRCHRQDHLQDHRRPDARSVGLVAMSSTYFVHWFRDAPVDAIEYLVCEFDGFFYRLAYRDDSHIHLLFTREANACDHAGSPINERAIRPGQMGIGIEHRDSIGEIKAKVINRHPNLQRRTFMRTKTRRGGKRGIWAKIRMAVRGLLQPKQEFHVMTIEFFNEHYSDLPDDVDASTVVGVLPDIATVGDIRAACAGHPKSSHIYPKIDGSGFYISDSQSKFT